MEHSVTFDLPRQQSMSDLFEIISDGEFHQSDSLSVAIGLKGNIGQVVKRLKNHLAKNDSNYTIQAVMLPFQVQKSIVLRKKGEEL